jgi:hypothetical protein
MGPNRIMPALLAAICLTLFLAACGGDEDATGAETAALEKEHDVEVLNQILGRQRAAVVAYEAVMPGLRGQNLALATRFRAQEQEHAVAILESLRALGGDEEVELEEIEPEELRGEAGRLRFLYEVENATIEDEIGAIGRLDFGAPRALLAATVANQAEHMVLLRRALGAKPLDWVPTPFEDGATPGP